MKRFTVTLFYIVALLAYSLLQKPAENLLRRFSAVSFTGYVIFGLLIAFFLIVLFKAARQGKDLEPVALTLATGLVFFFLLTSPRLMFRVTVFGFYLLGVLTAIDNKKTKSVLPFIIIIGTACLVEAASGYFFGGSFYYLDAWIYSLCAFSGFIAGALLL